MEDNSGILLLFSFYKASILLVTIHYFVLKLYENTSVIDS